MKHTLTTLALVGMVGVSGQAVAVSAPLASATIDWSSFTVTLYSLNPEFTPTISFSDEYTYIHADNSSGLVYDYAYDWTTSLSAISGPAEAMADATALHAATFGVGIASSFRQAGFTLSPMTLAVFSAYASAEIAGGIDASANVSLGTSGPGASGSGWQHSYAYIHLSDWGGIYSDSGTLTTSFLNLTGGDMAGNLYANAYASAPIPEPETYALMLAGLGLVGWMARRRRA